MTKSSVTAFTLVEMLLVVALLAILAALSFPVLERIKESMNASRCVSNLKNIGTAVHQYTADNQGRFPASRLQYQMDAGGNKKTVPFLPDVFLSSKILTVSDYASPSSVWWCPGDLERPANMRKHSYGHNQRIGGDYATPGTWDGHPNPQYDPSYAYLYAVKKPLSQIIYLIDYVDKDDPKWSSAVVASRWPMKKGSQKNVPPAARIDFERHAGVANALFLDGSVRPQRFDDLVGTEGKFFSPQVD